MAAGNGAQELEKLEAAITAARPRPKTPVCKMPIDAGTIVAFAEALAERVTAAGRYAREHGAYIYEVSIAFAKQLQAEAEQYAASLLASERRKMADSRRSWARPGNDHRRRLSVRGWAVRLSYRLMAGRWPWQ